MIVAAAEEGRKSYGVVPSRRSLVFHSFVLLGGGTRSRAMPAYPHSGVFSLEMAQEYFAQLNPIAKKIAQDIRETQLAYGQLWQSLKLQERNDIISETLMKPEISLRYFDKFAATSTSSPPSSSSAVSRTSSASSKELLSFCDSADSLVAIIMKQTTSGGGGGATTTTTVHATKEAASLSAPCEGKGSAAKSSSTPPPSATRPRCSYAYDSRNLSTFAVQRVALKVVHDDVLGSYRDEHSTPFSYKTKSQINLNVFAEGGGHHDDQVCLLADAMDPAMQQMVASYKKVSAELSSHMEKKMRPVDVSPQGASGCFRAYERFYNATASADATKRAPARTGGSSSSIVAPTANTAAVARPQASSNVTKKDLLRSLNPVLKTFAIYSDPYFEHEESTNLMQNCASTGVLTASSSSAATSDDDRDDDDDEEKTLCEDVKLLDNDANLRKGFDFLNNW